MASINWGLTIKLGEVHDGGVDCVGELAKYVLRICGRDSHEAVRRI